LEFEQLIAEGKLEEAGKYVNARQAITRKFWGGSLLKPEDVAEQRRVQLEREERNGNDPTKERYRADHGYRRRDTEETMYAKGSLWQLAERHALEAARAAYKGECAGGRSITWRSPRASWPN
jgi:hypothetical protein